MALIGKPGIVMAKTVRQDYEIVLPGYKSNMMDIQAAIGIHQLKEFAGIYCTP